MAQDDARLLMECGSIEGGGGTRNPYLGIVILPVAVSFVWGRVKRKGGWRIKREGEKKGGWGRVKILSVAVRFFQVSGVE